MPPPTDGYESSMLRAEPAARSVRALLPAMDIAARSMMESQAIAGTIAGVVADRALDHHWQGLFQYAAIRVGQELAASLLEKLETEAGDAPHEELDQPPGAPARLYRRLRALVAEAAASEQRAPLSPDSSQFWLPADEKLARGIVALRKALSAQQAELAELRFARGLRDVEAAYVVDLELADAQRAIDEAIATTAKLLGRRPMSRDNTPEGVLLEAYALDPRTARPPRRARRKPVLAEGALIAGRYEIEEPLGAGAFADVYRARDRDVTDHVVALKILRRRAADAAAVHAALRELQLIASVFHPSVVQLKDHGWHEGHLWFVMPLYRGETLATRLKRGSLTRRQAREIFEPLAEALATMHRAGVRHQDVKPENVFLANLDLDSTDETRQRVLPVMLDLGVAAKDAELVLAGTPAYFAPEVAARFAGNPDPPPVGPKADVFSLALTLMHALDPTPREYVAAGAVDAFVAYRAAHAPKISPERQLKDLQPYFARWLNFSPDARPSAEEFLRELRALTRPEEKAARRWATMRWALPTLFAVLAVFAAVVLAYSRKSELERRERQIAEVRAQEAKQRADNIYQDLTVQEAKRRELERDVARLEEEYQKSRMTREELATRLAQTEAELGLVAEREKALITRVGQQEREAHQLRESNGRVSSELAAATQHSEELSGELERQRARRQESENTVGQLREQVKRETDALEAARSRISDLEERLARMRNDLSAPPLDRPNKHGLTPSL